MATREIVTKKLQDLLIIIGIGAFVGFLAPFGMDRLPIYTSILYWVSVCVVGYLLYYPIISVAEKYLTTSVSRHWHRVAIGAFVASFPMCFVVPLMTALFFDYQVSMTENFSAIFPKTLIIGGVITLISFVKDMVIEQRTTLETTQAKDQEQLAKFMELLPLEKRGQLYCIESADHYLKVYTNKGHHLILMRFKDATDILRDYPGIQTHRSWWVAIDAVQSVVKENRKMLLNLHNGTQAPVSKSYSEQVKQAGIF